VDREERITPLDSAAACLRWWPLALVTLNESVAVGVTCCIFHLFKFGLANSSLLDRSSGS